MTTHLTTAAPGPEPGGSVILMIEDTFAEHECHRLAAENVKAEPSCSSCSPIGLDVRNIENSPITKDDVGWSEYKIVGLRAVRAVLIGHSNAGTFSIDENTGEVDVISAEWVFCSKNDSDGLITEPKDTLVVPWFGRRLTLDYFTHACRSFICPEQPIKGGGRIRCSVNTKYSTTESEKPKGATLPYTACLASGAAAIKHGKEGGMIPITIWISTSKIYFLPGGS